MRPEESQSKRPPAREEQSESEDSSENIARKLRGFFEGVEEKTLPQKEALKQSNASGIIPETMSATGNKCEEPSGNTTKPVLIATLSVEGLSEALEKPQKTSLLNENADPEASRSNGKSPAFRAFSCSGHETLSTATGSLPHAQHKTYRKEECQNGLPKERESKVAAFDGLLQYLQDYRHGLRELLVNNNVVIIEPIRQSRVKLEDREHSTRKSTSESTCRITGATIKKANITPASNTLPRQQKSQPILRRHFFYHPIRSNRELVDEELPDPDKVRHAREMFERTTKMEDPYKEALSNANSTVNTKNNRYSAPKITGIPKTENKNSNVVKRKYLTVDTVFRHNVLHKRWTDSGSLSSGVSSDLSCYETDFESADTFSRREEPADMFSSDDNDYADRSYYLDESDEGHYVAPEVLERIRACGTTVTYYGGRVIAASNGPVRSPMTLAIMDEIQKSKNFSKSGQGIRIIKDEHLEVKFRLVKSNSCGSRLELAGTGDDEKWSAIAEHSDEEEHDDSWKKQDAKKCDDVHKVSDTTENEDKNKEHTHSEAAQSSSRDGLDRVFSRINEGRSMSGQKHTHGEHIRGREPRMCFSPDKAKLLETGSNVLFDDMEFEEYEIAEDSLNVIEEKNIECNNNDEEGVQAEYSRGCQPASNDVSIATGAVGIQPNDSEKMSQCATSKANGHVQMTTWASRSMLFDFRNAETEGSHRPNQTTVHAEHL
jgi:hypothetical protein